MMQFCPLAVAVAITLGVTSVTSEESASLVGRDLKLGKAVNFLKQADQEINRASNETKGNETVVVPTETTDGSDDEAVCEPACEKGSGQFCGIDGECHLYSCGAWFEFASDRYTGNQHAGKSTLDCQDIAWTEPYKPNERIDGTGVYYPSVAFRCEDLDPPPIALGFNRRCSAKTGIHGISEFTCYELQDKTDFTSFLARATPGSLSCPAGEDGTAWPKFTYAATVESWIETDGMITMSEGFDATATFEEVRALTGTMYSNHEQKLSDPPTAGPTKAPTAPPTKSPTAAASVRAGGAAFWAAAALIAGLGAL